jgi:ATP-dependent DNA helicase RecQ
LREASIPEVRGYIEQLMADGLLRQTDDQYPVIALTEDGVSLLKDAAVRPDLSLARQRRVVREARGERRRGPVASGGGDVDQDLFDRLRAVRLRLARERNVPPYVIFHDTTLRELARLKPRSLAELSGIYGIGESKAARFGQEFIDEIVAES